MKIHTLVLVDGAIKGEWHEYNGIFLNCWCYKLQRNGKTFLTINSPLAMLLPHTYCGFFVQSIFRWHLRRLFYKVFSSTFLRVNKNDNISKNVIKPAFTVRCCSSNKCETLALSIFSRLGIECKSTSKFVCCRMKERKGEKWVLQNVVSIKAISLFLIKSCGLHLTHT